jgi:glycosyltransferase involved in cell wall biosynthesis
MDYYIIIPAHNEEAFLADTLNAVLKQSLPPKKIVVVNDHSTDTTQSIIAEFVSQYTRIDTLQISTSDDHIPGSKVVNAFNYGLTKLDKNYDFLVKLDADIVLPENYFEKIAYIFAGHPRVGIAGGFIYEQQTGGEWKLNHPMNKNHVRGAFKAYTRSCFNTIGGLKTAIGWDTVDELLAQFHGFEIFTENSLKVKHLRPVGRAYNKKARLLQGEAMYSMRYGILIMCIASLKMAWKQKKYHVFLDNFVGFFKARTENKAYMVSREEGDFIRKLRWKNIRSKLF